jgi:hypothetical protein
MKKIILALYLSMCFKLQNQGANQQRTQNLTKIIT